MTDHFYLFVPSITLTRGKEGERVIIFYENSIEFYIAYFAVWQAGAIVAPLNVFLHEDELLKIIHDAQPKVLIISPHLKEKIDKYPQDAGLRILTEIDKTSRIPREIPPIESELHDPQEVAAFLYTSGTTGFPKAVMLSFPISLSMHSGNISL